MQPAALTCRADLRWVADEPGSAILLIRPAIDDRTALVEESLEVEGAAVEHHVDGDGHRPFRIHIDGGAVVVRYRAQVRLAAPERTGPGRAPLPGFGALDLALHRWTLPSRYCPSDVLAPVARQLFGSPPHDTALLERVRAWVEQHIAYRPGASDGHTAADQTFQRRVGVCRDLAHLTITLLRALNVPARMVAAYALDLVPEDFHALVEAHDGTGWRLLDSTGLAPVATAVPIARGRDAADVAWASTSDGLRLTEIAVRVNRG